MNIDETFYRLTPVIVLDAVAETGLEPTGHISQLNSLENRVYDLKLENGAHVVAKFYRPGRWSQAQIQEEHDFLFELAQQEIPVCAPQALKGASVFNSNEILFALWARTGGREPEEFSEEDLEVLGRLIARVHVTGQRTDFLYRPQFTADIQIHDPLEKLIANKHLSAGFSSQYSNLARFFAGQYEQIQHELKHGRIHADAHKGNLLKRSDSWFLLDFDDSRNGPLLQDLWMFLDDIGDESEYRRNIFLDAYNSIMPFDYNELRYADILRAMRIIHYSGWISRRIDDPSFVQAFPVFASEEYWSEELDVLERLKKSVVKSASTIIGNADPGKTQNMQDGDSSAEATPELTPELTNKDFFWDLD